jgi:hypothetical protein
LAELASTTPLPALRSSWISSRDPSMGGVHLSDQLLVELGFGLAGAVTQPLLDIVTGERGDQLSPPIPM